MWAAIGKYVIGAGALLAIVTGIWLYGEQKYRDGKADCQSEANLAALEQFRLESEKLTGLSNELREQAQELANAKPKIIERYTRVEVEKPLPAGCVLDADRLQRINDGIREANTAR